MGPCLFRRPAWAVGAHAVVRLGIGFANEIGDLCRVGRFGAGLDKNAVPGCESDLLQELSCQCARNCLGLLDRSDESLVAELLAFDGNQVDGNPGTPM